MSVSFDLSRSHHFANLLWQGAYFQSTYSEGHSPLAIQACISSLLQAADATTANQILEVYGFPVRSTDNIRKIRQEGMFMEQTLPKTPRTGNQLIIAHQIFHDFDEPLNENIATYIKDKFNMDTMKVNFSNLPEIESKILKWIGQDFGTFGNVMKRNLYTRRLKKRVHDFHTRMIIASGFYLKIQFKVPFNTEPLIKRFVVRNICHSVISMYAKGRLEKYAKIENETVKMEILQLEIVVDSVDKDFQLLIFLPHVDSDINKVTEMFYSGQKCEEKNEIHNLMKVLKPTLLDICLPFFEVNSNLHSLESVIQYAGITRIFNNKRVVFHNLFKGQTKESLMKPDPGPSTSSKSDQPVIHNSFHHACFVTVDRNVLKNVKFPRRESQTELAKASSVDEATTSDKPVLFEVNRPFFFTVMCNSVVLYNGWVQDICGLLSANGQEAKRLMD